MTHASTLDVTHIDASESGVRSSRLREVATGAGVVIIGAAVLALAQQLSPAPAGAEFGSRWWPSVIGLAIVLLGLFVAVVGGLRPPVRDCDDVQIAGGWRLVALLALIACYGIGWQFVHFLVVTPLLIAGIMALLGGRGWKAMLVLPVVVTGILYGVFGMLLRVPL